MDVGKAIPFICEASGAGLYITEEAEQFLSSVIVLNSV
jgi:hypothetical protein